MSKFNNDHKTMTYDATDSSAATSLLTTSDPAMYSNASNVNSSLNPNLNSSLNSNSHLNSHLNSNLNSSLHSNSQRYDVISANQIRTVLPSPVTSGTEARFKDPNYSFGYNSESPVSNNYLHSPTSQSAPRSAILLADATSTPRKTNNISHQTLPPMTNTNYTHHPSSKLHNSHNNSSLSSRTQSSFQNSSSLQAPFNPNSSFQNNSLNGQQTSQHTDRNSSQHSSQHSGHHTGHHPQHSTFQHSTPEPHSSTLQSNYHTSTSNRSSSNQQGSNQQGSNQQGTTLAYRDPIPPNPFEKSEIPWSLDKILEVKDAYNILYEPNPETVTKINDSLNEFLDQHNLRQKSLRNQGFPPELRWECICGRKYGTGAGCWYHLHKSARSCDAIDYICIVCDEAEFKSRADVEKHVTEKHGWIPPPIEKKKGKAKKGAKKEGEEGVESENGKVEKGKGEKGKNGKKDGKKEGKNKDGKKDGRKKKDKNGLEKVGNSEVGKLISHDLESNQSHGNYENICKVENIDDYGQIIEVGDESSLSYDNHGIQANQVLQANQMLQANHEVQSNQFHAISPLPYIEGSNPVVKANHVIQMPSKTDKTKKKKRLKKDIPPPPLPKAPKVEVSTPMAHYINENGQEQSYYEFTQTPPPPIITTGQFLSPTNGYKRKYDSGLQESVIVEDNLSSNCKTITHGILSHTDVKRNKIYSILPSNSTQNSAVAKFTELTPIKSENDMAQNAADNTYSIGKSETVRLSNHNSKYENNPDSSNWKLNYDQTPAAASIEVKKRHHNNFKNNNNSSNNHSNNQSNNHSFAHKFSSKKPPNFTPLKITPLNGNASYHSVAQSNGVYKSNTSSSAITLQPVQMSYAGSPAVYAVSPQTNHQGTIFVTGSSNNSSTVPSPRPTLGSQFTQMAMNQGGFVPNHAPLNSIPTSNQSLSHQNTVLTSHSPSTVTVPTSVQLPQSLISVHRVNWNSSMVIKWLETINLGMVRNYFVAEEVQGWHLDHLSSDNLEGLGLKKIGNQLTFKHELKRLQMLQDVNNLTHC